MNTPNVITYRRELHKIAEISQHEIKTQTYIVNHLQNKKCKLFFVDKNTITNAEHFSKFTPFIFKGHEIYMTSVKAKFKFNDTGINLAFRCDMDGLPLEESTCEAHKPFRLNFRAEKNMHACAHDGHMAIALALCDYLDKNFNSFKGSKIASISIIFQCAEEGCTGAQHLIYTNFLNDIDHLYCYHIGLGLKSNHFAFNVDNFFATTKFYLEILGKKTHAARPHDGINALVPICNFIHNSMQLLDEKAFHLINFGDLNTTGCSNIIPDKASVLFELRAKETKTLKDLIAKMETFLDKEKQASKAQFNLERLGYAYSIENSKNLICNLQKANQNLNKEIKEVNYSFNASEDASILMSFLQEKGKDACYFMIGADLASSHHTNTFDFDETALENGLALLQQLVLNYK